MVPQNSIWRSMVPVSPSFRATKAKTSCGWKAKASLLTLYIMQRANKRMVGTQLWGSMVHCSPWFQKGNQLNHSFGRPSQATTRFWGWFSKPQFWGLVVPFSPLHINKYIYIYMHTPLCLYIYIYESQRSCRPQIVALSTNW